MNDAYAEKEKLLRFINTKGEYWFTLRNEDELKIYDHKKTGYDREILYRVFTVIRKAFAALTYTATTFFRTIMSVLPNGRKRRN